MPCHAEQGTIRRHSGEAGDGKGQVVTQSPSRSQTKPNQTYLVSRTPVACDTPTTTPPTHTQAKKTPSACKRSDQRNIVSRISTKSHVVRLLQDTGGWKLPRGRAEPGAIHAATEAHPINNASSLRKHNTHLWRVSSRRTSASSSFPALTRQNTSTWVSFSKDARMWAPRNPDAPVRRIRWGGRTEAARNREYLDRMHYATHVHMYHTCVRHCRCVYKHPFIPINLKAPTRGQLLGGIFYRMMSQKWTQTSVASNQIIKHHQPQHTISCYRVRIMTTETKTVATHTHTHPVLRVLAG